MMTVKILKTQEILRGRSPESIARRVWGRRAVLWTHHDPAHGVARAEVLEKMPPRFGPSQWTVLATIVWNEE